MSSRLQRSGHRVATVHHLLATARVYVFSVNQQRRELSTSQRAAIAAQILPFISAEVQAKRVARIAATQRQRQEGEIQSVLTGSPPGQPEGLTARAIAADIMGVADGYVAEAVRLQRDAPALFEQMRLGRISLQSALRRVQGTAADGLSAEARALRQRVTALLHDPASTRDFSARLDEFLKEFEGQ